MDDYNDIEQEVIKWLIMIIKKLSKQPVTAINEDSAYRTVALLERALGLLYWLNDDGSNEEPLWRKHSRKKFNLHTFKPIKE